MNDTDAPDPAAGTQPLDGLSRDQLAAELEAARAFNRRLLRELHATQEALEELVLQRRGDAVATDQSRAVDGGRKPQAR